MAQKAKRRIKPAAVAVPLHNGNGFHKQASWVPGDPIETHPLASVIGSHKNDPYWDKYIQMMKDLRQDELERDLKNLEIEMQYLCPSTKFTE